MHLISCRYQAADRIGIVTGDSVGLIATGNGWPQSMLALIDAGPARWSALAADQDRAIDQRVPLSAVELRAPIPRPRKNIMCLGWNYAEHVRESAGSRNAEIPEHPVVFTKNTTSVNSPYGDIPWNPDVTTQLDWEVELAVIVGIGGHRIPAAEALYHVFGYTVINDISARDLQFRHKQYFLGKSLDGTCPMGPVIVTADEIPDPQDLELRTWVNGEIKQSSSTRYQVFSIAAVMSILSRGMPLEPGDIISTGTPGGVGFARNPPEFLKPGDLVECEVQGIGRLRNLVR
ncbi:MAG: fumarylacetoacetate hydrolase family protein [Gammaproteobacteria bacterium]|nr:fumarylacetoacetate hydrolase family protein [Gammaproteobacteria bacterium]